METVVLSPNVFKTFQVNGQRITINQIIKAEGGGGYEVFIGHLPRNLYEDELLPVLLSVGHLSELRIMMNFSGNNRGFAFARFSSKESADNAVKYLDNFEIRAGRSIVVLASRDKKKLYVSRFPWQMKEEKVSGILRCVTDNVTKVEMKYFKKNGTCQHFCIVEYKTHMDACKARRELVVKGRELFQSDIVVDWAFVEKSTTMECQLCGSECKFANYNARCKTNSTNRRFGRVRSIC